MSNVADFYKEEFLPHRFFLVIVVNMIGDWKLYR
uniref:Uncharacterized protein n=1 Tax=Tetranychus urticae TaxID=32264 RepID=T1K3H4_TETUR